MGDLSKLLQGWITRLLPKQSNRGAGSVLIGKAGGDVTTSSTTTSNVTIINLVAPAPEQPPLALTTTEQRAVLGMIRRLRNSEAVFVFMQRQFGTRMVIDLQPGQLLRVRRYVEVIERNKLRSKEQA